MTNVEARMKRVLRHLKFVILSTFDIRHSSFVLPSPSIRGKFLNVESQAPKRLASQTESGCAIRPGPGEAQAFPRYGSGRLEESRQFALRLEGAHPRGVRWLRAGCRWFP